MTMSHCMQNINKQIGIIKKNQMEILELKNTITEMKNSLGGATVDVNWQKNQ